jgi:integrase
MADINKRDGKKGASYQVRYRAGDSYKYRTFTRRKDAQEFIESLSGRKSINSEISTVGQAVQLWLNVCEKEGRDGRVPVARATLQEYEARAERINAYTWGKELSDLKASDIVEFRSWLLKHYSRYQANKALLSLNSVMVEMGRRNHIGGNPCGGVTVQLEHTEIEIPSRAEVSAILKAAEKLENSKNEQTKRTWERYRPMLHLAADSGLRPQEYLALPEPNVLTEGVRVTQALNKDGKIGKVKTKAARRTVFTGGESLSMVRHYMRKHGRGLVFGTRDDTPLALSNVRRQCWQPICEAAGLMDGDLPKYTLYSLRHFYASAMIEQSRGLKYIQSQMGHKDATTTLNIYGHLLKDSPDMRGGGAL